MGKDDPQPLVRYPCEYEYKVIGPAAPDFLDFVRGRVEGALGTKLADDQLEALPSKGGKYTSVRVRVRLTAEEQRQAVYQALSNQPRIVFYL